MRGRADNMGVGKVRSILKGNRTRDAEVRVKIKVWMKSGDRNRKRFERIKRREMNK